MIIMTVMKIHSSTEQENVSSTCIYMVHITTVIDYQLCICIHSGS